MDFICLSVLTVNPNDNCPDVKKRRINPALFSLIQIEANEIISDELDLTTGPLSFGNSFIMEGQSVPGELSDTAKESDTGLGLLTMYQKISKYR